MSIHMQLQRLLMHGTVTQEMTGLCHEMVALLSGTNKSERNIIEKVASKIKFVVSDSSDWDRKVYKDE